MSFASPQRQPRTAARAGDFLREVANAARDNPVSAALIGVGALWLLGRSARDATAPALRPFMDAVSFPATSRPGEQSPPTAGEGKTAGERITQGAHLAQRGLADLWEAQPLVVGAAGLAIGAGLATLFPATAIEADMLGTHAERLASQAKGFIAEKTAQPKELDPAGG